MNDFCFEPGLQPLSTCSTVWEGYVLPLHDSRMNRKVRSSYLSFTVVKDLRGLHLFLIPFPADDFHCIHFNRNGDGHGGLQQLYDNFLFLAVYAHDFGLLALERPGDDLHDVIALNIHLDFDLSEHMLDLFIGDSRRQQAPCIGNTLQSSFRRSFRRGFNENIAAHAMGADNSQDPPILRSLQLGDEVVYNLIFAVCRRSQSKNCCFHGRLLNEELFYQENDEADNADDRASQAGDLRQAFVLFFIGFFRDAKHPHGLFPEPFKLAGLSQRLLGLGVHEL